MVMTVAVDDPDLVNADGQLAWAAALLVPQ
jgi:hypothetical protein